MQTYFRRSFLLHLKCLCPLGIVEFKSEALEESTVPYRVDVVDLTQTAARLADHVRQEGVAWKD